MAALPSSSDRCCLDAAQQLAVLRSYGLQLRFEAIGGKCADVVGKVYLFHIQLVLDDLASSTPAACSGAFTNILAMG